MVEGAQSVGWVATTVYSRSPIRLPAPQTPLDERLQQVCQACLCREPGRRYATAVEFADRLHEALKSS